MLARVFFTLRMAWHQRFVLQQYNRQAALQVTELRDLDVVALKAQGIRVLVLDFDGVLAAHGEKRPSICSTPNITVFKSPASTLMG